MQFTKYKIYYSIFQTTVLYAENKKSVIKNEPSHYYLIGFIVIDLIICKSILPYFEEKFAKNAPVYYN